MNDYNFGNYLYKLRTDKKISQSELASKLGVTNKAVSKWENGAAYPSAKLIYPLAKELGISVEQIYSSMCSDKKPKNIARRILDVVFKFKKTAFILPLVLAFVMYIIFVIFGQNPDKQMLMIAAPVMSLVVFGGVYLVFFIQLKNPMCPGWFLDVFEIVTILVFGLGAIISTVTFLMNVKTGFVLNIMFGYTILSVVSLVHNKRP